MRFISSAPRSSASSSKSARLRSAATRLLSRASKESSETTGIASRDDPTPIGVVDRRGDGLRGGASSSSPLIDPWGDSGENMPSIWPIATLSQMHRGTRCVEGVKGSVRWIRRILPTKMQRADQTIVWHRAARGFESRVSNKVGSMTKRDSTRANRSQF